MSKDTNKPKQRKADQPGMTGVEGKFERNQYDYIDRLQEILEKTDDKKKRRDEIDENYLSTLERVTDLLENHSFTSDDVHVYYSMRKKEETLSYKIPIYFKIILSIIILIGSLYLIIAEIPKSLKGPILFYFNYYEGLSLSDLAAIFLLFTASFLFVKQVTKLFELKE